MWVSDEYQAAKALYFGIGRDANVVAGLEALKGVFQRNQNSTKDDERKQASQAAYCLGAIHLSRLLNAQLDQAQGQLTPAGMKVWREGLEWLKKAHVLGNNSATLLLGKIFQCEFATDLSGVKVRVEGIDLGRMRDEGFWPGLHSLVHSAHYLSKIAATDKKAAQILFGVAKEYVYCLDRDSAVRLYMSMEEGTSDARGMFFSSDEMEFCVAVKAILEDFQQTAGTRAPTNNELANMAQEVFDLAHPHAEKGVMWALNVLFHVYSGDPNDPVAQLLAIHCPPDPEKAEKYGKRIWERRLEALSTALHWLENATRLGCKKTYLLFGLDRYRVGLTAYLKARIAGKSDEEASSDQDLAIESLPADDRTSKVEEEFESLLRAADRDPEEEEQKSGMRRTLP